MRAIDLYSGVGGWSLGLALAGVEVVASYERFEPANQTNRNNNRHPAIRADIRALDLETLPKNIDLIVGSPPCTQFSYSNRGGGGNVADGLADIRCFLEAVDHLRPKFWAMENVPRTAGIVANEMLPGGKLEDFAHLQPTIAVVNMEDWGLPQRRRRCVVGNFDFELLYSYTAHVRHHTLGDVVTDLSRDVVNDTNYGLKLPRSLLVDHVEELPLNEEETRVNRSSKVAHPIYNSMPFPDPLDRSARTVTATCTRVSRESIVIASPGRAETFRRLTLREKATLQGFPITFQFYGASHGQKATMIGNAVPPVFAYYLANACLKTPTERLPALRNAAMHFVAPDERPPDTRVDLAGGRYRADRTFRFAIPGLNFKSGVRFELSNKKDGSFPSWGVSFVFGSSKSIQTLVLDQRAIRAAMCSLPCLERGRLNQVLEGMKKWTETVDVKRMQDVWTRRGPGGTRPFDLVDRIGNSVGEVEAALSSLTAEQQILILAEILRAEYRQPGNLTGLKKLERNAARIVAGAICGAYVNEALETAEIRGRTDRSGGRAATRKSA